MTAILSFQTKAFCDFCCIGGYIAGIVGNFLFIISNIGGMFGNGGFGCLCQIHFNAIAVYFSRDIIYTNNIKTFIGLIEGNT